MSRHGVTWPVQFVVRLTQEDADYLDKMVVAGGFSSRADLTRSLLHSIIVDEQVLERGQPVGMTAAAGPTLRNRGA